MLQRHPLGLAKTFNKADSYSPKEMPQAKSVEMT